MKRLLRWVVSKIVKFTIKYGCETNGDIADLSAGPCQRCVGQEVRGAGDVRTT